MLIIPPPLQLQEAASVVKRDLSEFVTTVSVDTEKALRATAEAAGKTVSAPDDSPSADGRYGQTVIGTVRAKRASPFYRILPSH